MEFVASAPNSDSKLLQQIFFNRPVNTLSRSKVALIVGRNAKLNDVSKMYEIFLNFGLNILLVIDEKLNLPELPADIILTTSKHNVYINTDEVLAQIQNCSSLFIYSGGETNAAMSVLASKIALSFKGFLVTDDKLIISNDWLNSTICINSTYALLKNSKQNYSKNMGVKLKSEYILNIAKNQSSSIVSIDNHQALAVDNNNTSEAVVINHDEINKTVLTAIIFALLSERREPLSDGWFDYVLASGYLYRNVYSSGGTKALKQFLDSQF